MRSDPESDKPELVNLIFNAHKVALGDLHDFSSHPHISGFAEYTDSTAFKQFPPHQRMCIQRQHARPNN